MKIIHLMTNHIENPLGFDLDEVRVSYVVTESAGTRQSSARLLISTDPQFETIVYDSGNVESVYGEDGLQTGGICPAGTTVPLEIAPRTRYYWRVWVCTDAGEEAWSEPVWFETAKGADEPWAGSFIRADFSQDQHPILFKDFEVKKAVSQARIYVLGLGEYELYLNGKKVGDEYLLPGLHSYDCWLQYQTFELNPENGENRLEVLLGEGWYKGPYGLKRRLPRYGTEYALIAEVHLCYADGTEEVFGTDLSWKAKKSRITFDSIYDGETIDDASPVDAQVYGVAAASVPDAPLRPRKSPYLRIQETRKPVLIETPAGEKVLDFGQNMVGWVSFRNFLPAGTSMLLQYGEILQGGNFYRGNLRSARCEFSYCSDGTEKTVRPHFTFYGFRYVKISGWDGPIDPQDFTGCVIYSQMEQTGWIETSDQKLNRLFENIVWGQKGNFLDVPTDCPQRDERMGWTGDAQVFSDTACFNMNTYEFYRKFGQDLYCEQKKYDGSVPFVVPTSAYELGGATTWGDAATVIPWQTYLHFGDSAILADQYESMKLWVEYMRRRAGGSRLWNNGRHFGDWLALDGKVPGGVYGRTDFYYIATVFYFWSTQILAKSAAILKKDSDAAEYGQLAAEIRAAFQDEYFTPAGRLAVDTQTAYALAAYMDLVPARADGRFAADFRAKMRESGFSLETGFAGTPYLLEALSKWGMDDVAYQLLLREEYPGWLYEVNMGATTVWERWNSVMPDGSMNPAGMNSLNHYAYGSVGAWMYRYLCGIRPDEKAPGFARAVMEPHPDHRLSHAQAVLDTGYGRYVCGWKWQNGELLIHAEVPFGGQAVLTLPENKEGLIAKTLAPGTYEIICTPAAPAAPRFSMESGWREVVADPIAKEVTERYFARAVNHQIAFQDEMITLQELADSPFSELDPENEKALDRELRKL